MDPRNETIPQPPRRRPFTIHIGFDRDQTPVEVNSIQCEGEP